MAEIKSLVFAERGSLQVGKGKEYTLEGVCLRRVEDRVEILLSCDERHVWVTLPVASLAALEKKINAVLQPQ